MFDPQVPAVGLNLMYRLDCLAVAYGLQVMLVKVWDAFEMLHRQFTHRLVQYLLGAQANRFEVAAVARQHPAVDIPHIQGRRHAIGQGLNELQLVIEHLLSLEAGFYLAAQIDYPHQREQQQYASGGNDFTDDALVITPGLAAHPGR
ncbi:hypothetical protein D3C79_604960 [compost metagenome]